MAKKVVYHKINDPKNPKPAAMPKVKHSMKKTKAVIKNRQARYGQAMSELFGD